MKYACVLLVVATGCPPTGASPQPGWVVGNVRCQRTSTTTDLCRIDQPVVNFPSWDYRQVRFRSGDQVTLRAGGCAQSGGSGSTWKRYVDPDDDTNYHGLIQIPGVTPKLVTVKEMLARGTVTIPPGISDYLRLGYTDDNFHDNGYWSPDPGTQSQCLNQPDAWLELTIVHPDQQGMLNVPDPGAFDLWSYQLDVNGFGFNPAWGDQVLKQRMPTPDQCGNFQWLPQFNLGTETRLGNPPCASYPPSVDAFDTVIPVLCKGMIDGHVNWASATFTGALAWGKHDPPVPAGDDDYNLSLTTPGNPGQLAGNNGAMLLEFDSDETVDLFQSTWWSDAHHAVDSDHGADFFTSAHAIVTGLVGLDCVHDCHAELHPVFAIALETKDDPQDDVWAMFVRNWGDEGMCSASQHTLHLPDGKYSFAILWKEGATGFTVTQSQFEGTLNMPERATTSTLVNASGTPIAALVTFTIPEYNPLLATKYQGFVDGSLHIRWDGAKPATPTAHAPLVARAQPIGESETLLKTLVSQMSPAQRATYDAALPPRREAPAQLARHPITLVQTHDRVRQPTVRTPPAATASIRQVRDPEKAARMQALSRAVCQAYNGAPPGVPAGACAPRS